MPFRYTEVYPMLYPQYFDEATDRPLLASPGGVYDMRPAGNLSVPVPPQDGRWQAVGGGDEPAAPGPAPEPETPPEPAPEQPPAEPVTEPADAGTTAPAEPA